MKRFIPCLLVGIYFLFTSAFCCGYDYTEHYTIVNNSDYPVCVQVSPLLDEDTLYKCGPSERYVIEPFESKKVEVIGTLENYFDNLEESGAEYLQFIVVDAEVPEWAQGYCTRVRENIQILKRYQWTLEDFEANDRTLVYP